MAINSTNRIYETLVHVADGLITVEEGMRAFAHTSLADQQAFLDLCFRERERFEREGHTPDEAARIGVTTD
jgi:hypothetical protein